MKIRYEVEKFAEEMEKKLLANDHKKDWKSLSSADAEWFLDRLKDEVVELEEALAIGTVLDITQEAADVGNFAMMIMDVFGRDIRNGAYDNRMGHSERKSFSGQVRT